MNNDELMHYGVLGMHWGVRRGRTGQTIAKAQRKMTKADVDRSYESFKANITNNGKHKSEHPGRRARRSCHSLELAMDAFYKDLWRDNKCSDLKQSSIS